MYPPRDRARAEQAIGLPSDGLFATRLIVEQRDHLGGDCPLHWLEHERI